MESDVATAIAEITATLEGLQRSIDNLDKAIVSLSERQDRVEAEK